MKEFEGIPCPDFPPDFRVFDGVRKEETFEKIYPDGSRAIGRYDSKEYMETHFSDGSVHVDENYGEDGKYFFSYSHPQR